MYNLNLMFKNKKSTTNNTSTSININNTNMNVNTKSYIGGKGYTINKTDLSLIQLNKIKKELLVKPFVLGCPVTMNVEYPVYRESSNKLYVPKFYGCKTFGIPETNKLPDLRNTVADNIIFTGELRENQLPVIEAYTNMINTGGYGGLLELPCGYGKTLLALYIVFVVLRCPTIWICHKEFLMEQAISTIRQYFPNVRIGRVQGQIIDVVDKDIVFCMLQSLSMKDYPDTMFQSFGLMVVDEVHHISSEVFSRALFKVVTKYTLGLSATMERKDGTTHVFKMFLGDIIYSAERDKTENVIVLGIEYVSNDPIFNAIEKDSFDNLANSKMLSKICTHKPRLDFITQVLNDALLEDIHLPNGDITRRHVMVIASYKNILKTLYETVAPGVEKGFYVGGMKDKDLKMSEDKQAVFSTYSMAAEGLDIPELSSLAMVSPMRSVIQPIGRALRKKHPYAVIVYDFIDGHYNFKNQWRGRLVDYKKQNYSVYYIKSTHYEPFSPNNHNKAWKVLHEKSNSIKINIMGEEEEEQGEEEKQVDNDICMLKL